jgi:hypothetical protein
MDQAVMVFDDATERDVALGTAVVSEGMVSYLADSNELQFNDGADWRTFAAGTGLPIANGGTGGTTVAAAQDNLRVGLVPISPSSVVVAGAGSSASANDLGKVTFGTATTADPSVITNSASPSSFAMLVNGTVVAGALLCTVATGTSGVLFSAGDFSGGDKTVDSGDTLNVTYTFSLDAA